MATTQAPQQAATPPAETEHTPTAAPVRGARFQHKQRIDFQDPEYRALVRRMVCTGTTAEKSATDDEFDLFMRYCERMQLDPLAKQVYFMKRGTDDAETGRKARGGPELSIDSLRLIAERTGDYCGQTPREWADVVVNRGEAHITWHPVWPFQGREPYACRVGVYRAGFSEPLFAVARWSAYVQTTGYGNNAKPNRMWARMGPEQLGKCAEALALRQAFPNELGGSYTTDEMGQAENDAEPARQQQRRQPPAAHRQQQQTAQAADARPAREPHPMAAPADRPGDSPTPALFPYGMYERVPLDAKWPADATAPGALPGEYVIPVVKLQEAEEKASDRLKELAGKNRPRREAAARALLDALADELSRRADEDAQAEASEPGYGS